MYHRSKGNNMIEKTLWDVFNLAENNLDQGAGILYCLRYDESRIRDHQKSVVNALKSMGVELDDIGERIGAKAQRELNVSEYDRFYILLEELSCLNEALEYSEIGLNRFGNFSQLKNALKCQYDDLLKDSSIADAYTFITLGIPRIVNDIRDADYQNRVLSSSDRKELDDLADFVQRQISLLDKPKDYVMFRF